MPQDGPDNNNMQIFKPGDATLESRQTSLASCSPVHAEKPPDFLTYWRVIRKRRWTVLTALTLLFGLVLVGTLKQKPVYRARALLEIEKENPSLMTPQELFQLDEVSEPYLETEYRVLGSEDLADRVIAQLGLDRVTEFRPRKQTGFWSRDNSQTAQTLAAGAAATDRDPFVEDTVLTQFQDRLNVKPVRRSRAVEISFDSQDPNLAARVVNTLASEYISKNLQARWDATQKASEWLSQQLLDLTAKLEKSENELQTYASENGLLFLETDKGSSENVVNQSLRELQEELTNAQAARYEKESLFRLVQTSDYGSLPGIFENKLMQDLSERLAELQREHAELATTFNETYPRVQQIQSQVVEIQAALERERQRAALKISNDYIAAVRRETLVRQAFAEKQAQANLIAEKSVQYGILRREVESNKSMYEGLLQQLKEAGVSAGMKASNIRIVDPAKVPYRPVSPKVALNLGLAILLGLGLGILAAFFQEHIDLTIENAEDVDHFLRVPALAFIPSFASLNGHRATGSTRMHKIPTLGLAYQENPPDGTLSLSPPQDNPIAHRNADLSEAFRGLRTSVLLSSPGRAVHSILVTSAQPGEGKTTIAMNLAISLALLGRRVLLVDADMRSPNLQKHFPQRNSHLSSYLAGEGAWQDMVYHTAVHGLYVLLCGPLPANPAELLSSDRMRALVREAAGEYSFVILDSPPLLSVADTRILASAVDATILVVKGGETPRQAVQYAEAQARSAGANLIGVVLNNLNIHSNRDLQRVYCHSDYTTARN